jgi:hypothetical protein
VAARAGTLSITGISMAGGNPQLLIQSDIGITNQIQCKTNLGQANWVVVTNLLVAQSPYPFVDLSTPRAPSRFVTVQVWGRPPVCRFAGPLARSSGAIVATEPEAP